MTLLIVDDEELTRSGVISSIDWEKLGITEIFQAEDGLRGLEAARAYHPEIILSDVRMPRMDGITMLKNLEEELPDTSVIFMSGYSDKQYLKDAIRLRAVRYIDKPIQASEVHDAVQEAIRLYQSRLHSHRGQQIQSIETRAELARLLTSPSGADMEEIRRLSSSLQLALDEKTWFTTVIIHVSRAIEPTLMPQENVLHGLEAFLGGLGLTCLYVTRRIQYMVFEIIGNESLPETILHAILSYLKSQISAEGSFYITAGESVQGISNAFISYSSAVGLIQNSFFFPTGSILTAKDPDTSVSPAAPPDSRFAHALSSQNPEEAEEFLRELQQHYTNSRQSLPNLARDRYYRLFMQIENERVRTPLPTGEEDTILSAMERCFSYQDLHETLVQKTKEYFKDLEKETPKPESTTIQMIEEYISQNYMRDGLSVKDISTHVFLSASYVCTVFKNETGRTLSQYITEYRMERAKQLLSDPRYRITDISSQVGYSDGNYFGKSFKKYTGMTPSEYRESRKA